SALLWISLPFAGIAENALHVLRRNWPVENFGSERRLFSSDALQIIGKTTLQMDIFERHFVSNEEFAFQNSFDDFFIFSLSLLVFAQVKKRLGLGALRTANRTRRQRMSAQVSRGTHLGEGGALQIARRRGRGDRRRRPARGSGGSCQIIRELFRVCG